MVNTTAVGQSVRLEQPWLFSFKKEKTRKTVFTNESMIF